MTVHAPPVPLRMRYRTLPRRRRSRIVVASRALALVAVVAALATPPLLGAFGMRMLVVEGGSMAPTYARGEVLLVGAPTGADLVPGEPVVVGDGESRYVHRVVQIDGDRARLRGDANTAADPGWVRQAQVTGVVVAHVAAPSSIPVVALTSIEGRIALVLALVLLIGLPLASRGVKRRGGVPSHEAESHRMTGGSGS